MKHLEIAQQAGNLAGQFTAKGIVGPNGRFLGKVTLDSGDVQINFDAKHLPFLSKDEIVFVAVTVVKTIVSNPDPLAAIPDLTKKN